MQQTIEPSIEWFVNRDGKQFGPVTPLELEKLVELGHLRPDDHVWRNGMNAWIKVHEMPRPIAAKADSASEPPAAGQSTATDSVANDVQVAPPALDIKDAGGSTALAVTESKTKSTPMAPVVATVSLGFGRAMEARRRIYGKLREAWHQTPRTSKKVIAGLVAVSLLGTGMAIGSYMAAGVRTEVNQVRAAMIRDLAQNALEVSEREAIATGERELAEWHENLLTKMKEGKYLDEQLSIAGRVTEAAKGAVGAVRGAVEVARGATSEAVKELVAALPIGSGEAQQSPKEQPQEPQTPTVDQQRQSFAWYVASESEMVAAHVRIAQNMAAAMARRLDDQLGKLRVQFALSPVELDAILVGGITVQSALSIAAHASPKPTSRNFALTQFIDAYGEVYVKEAQTSLLAAGTAIGAAPRVNSAAVPSNRARLRAAVREANRNLRRFERATTIRAGGSAGGGIVTGRLGRAVSMIPGVLLGIELLGVVGEELALREKRKERMIEAARSAWVEQAAEMLKPEGALGGIVRQISEDVAADVLVR